MIRRSAGFFYQGIYYLAASFYFGAVFLRSILIFRDTPELGRVLILLLIWLALAISEPAISLRWRGYFLFYLVLQTILIVGLMAMPGFTDFFATLFVILSMQVMLHLSPRTGAVWIGLWALIMTLMMLNVYRSQAIALTLINTAGNIFLGSYALATRRAQTLRTKNQTMVDQLQKTNQQLQAYATQLEQLTVTRERNRLARELHDAVTQTVFSMTLTTQSALLLLKRDPPRVSDQLNRLSQLARSALSEMQLLISELRPEKTTEGGWVLALRRHLAENQLLKNLSVSLEKEGDQPLDPKEEQGLFRIAQEALNNIVKHAGTNQAQIRLHLAEPFWMEILDQGQGFNLEQAQNRNTVGLFSMGERASEIGWHLKITSSPGGGTCVRVEKLPSGGR